MNDIPRSIFRREAVRRYMERREQTILPRFVSPRVFYYLWALLGLLLAGGAIAWVTPVPTYASGFGIVVTQDGGSQDANDIVLAVFLPPENLSRVQAGQTGFVQGSAGADRVSCPIVAVESQIVSPDEARERFALDAGTAPIITQPAALAIAQFQSPLSGKPAAAYLGSVYRVEVEVGTERLLSLLGE